MKSPLLIAFFGTLWVGCNTSHQEQEPLRVSNINPRYFTDGSGKAVYLTGSHTWNNLVDMHTAAQPDTFNFQAYLDFMESYHHNFMRLWAWELFNWNTSGNNEEDPKIHQVGPHPWERIGPGNAVDGKPKFDLTKFNPDYFEHLRQRVLAAQERNIYVAIMLFEGWGLQFSPDAFMNHPFYPMNNINEMELDTAADRRLEIHELVHDKVLEIQEAYVKKVIETVHDLNNVLYEISNENHPPSSEWQYHMINLIKDYEKELGTQHPVGMTFQYKGGSNQTLFDSPAEWISPNAEGGYRDDPPAADGKKVIITDTDHLWGIGGNRQWVWKSFLRGMYPIFMDPYDEKVLEGAYNARNMDAEMIRKNMGYTMEYAQKMDLIHMVPDTVVSSSKYCLANKGTEYLVYIPEGNSVELNLSEANGDFNVEWFEPATGTKEEDTPIEGGTTIQLTAPFSSGEAVLYVKAGD